MGYFEETCGYCCNRPVATGTQPGRGRVTVATGHRPVSTGKGESNFCNRHTTKEGKSSCCNRPVATGKGELQHFATVATHGEKIFKKVLQSVDEGFPKIPRFL